MPCNTMPHSPAAASPARIRPIRLVLAGLAGLACLAGAPVSGNTGAKPSGPSGTTASSLDDASEGVHNWVVVDDVFDARSMAPTTLDLALNDLTDPEWFEVETIEVLREPSHGRLVKEPYGARFRFVPDLRYVGPDDFDYRICLVSGECKEGSARIRVHPFLNPLMPRSAGHSGYLEADVYGVENVVVSTTALQLPVTANLQMGVDISPYDRWDDSGVDDYAVEIPAAVPGQPRDHLLKVVVSGSVDLFLGVDEDGDGQLSEGEASCRFNTNVCEIAYTRGAQASAWILRARNKLDQPVAPVVHIYDIPAEPSDGSFSATAPGVQTLWAFETMRVGWNDPRLPEGGHGVAALRFTARNGSPLFDQFIYVERQGNAVLPLPLLSGRSQELALPAMSRQDRMFIDVPAGAQELAVTLSSDAPGGTPFYLARHVGSSDRTDVSIAAAPGNSSAVLSGLAGGEGATVSLAGSALRAGRWYIVPENAGAEPVRLTVSATISAAPPQVGFGSYFNPDRSGSGIFLYPAGSKWVGLWYTYLQGGRPTWYYLEDAAPGPNGIWSSRIYRATWVGSYRTLSAVGEVMLTPSGPDAFVLSYTLDGVAGSQPMQGLGSGCLAGNGSAFDISSTWFDPARPGTGYSVQVWDNYEYFAAFVYDEQGVPLFLAAESPSDGQDEMTLSLQRLKSACPTCDWQGSSRVNVGVLTRRISQGTLDEVEIDAVWNDTNRPNTRAEPSSWTALDRVQLLGGPGSTQGCAP